MRGYAGLCGAMRGYAVLCGAMVFLGMRLIAKNEAQGQIAIWPQERRLASKKPFGRENGVVKTDLVVKPGS